MAPNAEADGIYSATYSNVPVFEFNIKGHHIMRRKIDHYINATHILKAAGFDKPARTRILERDVQKGKHEKIQGGYGKYQGTWIPLEEGRSLAERNSVLDMLRPIFDFVPGNVSPPQAPKHTTNSGKPRAPRQPSMKKMQKSQVNAPYAQMTQDYDNISSQPRDEDSVDNSTIASASFMEEDDAYHHPYGNSRKRKRVQESAADQEHTYYGDQLLDYFMLSVSDASYGVQLPDIPNHFQTNRPIDDQGHTVLHWAAAMGDIDVVRFFLDRGGDVYARNKRGETPLIRAVLFTNNHETETMLKLVHLLIPTIKVTDNHGATVLHHIAMTTNSQAKKKCARYYLDVILTTFADHSIPHEFMNFINHQDHNGDTALHIVARHRAKKCIRALQGRSARGDILNHSGETADQMMQKTRAVNNDFISSSPVPAINNGINGHGLPTSSNPIDVNHYHSQSARSFSQSFNSIIQDKALQITLAYEAQIREKDEELAEAQRLLAMMEKKRAEAHAYRLKLEKEAYWPTEKEDRAEVKALFEEALSLSEQIQHQELHAAIREEEAKLPPEAHLPDDMNKLTDEQVVEKYKTAWWLKEEQEKRRRLTYELVEAEMNAGMSPQGQKYKRLVATILGIPEEDVAGVIPEILEVLQQDKIDNESGPSTAATK
ncbi:Transcription factor mbp1 [Lecanora helva]